MMTIKYRRRALRDLDGVGEFIAQDDPAAAERVRRHLLDRVNQLRKRPFIGHLDKGRGVRTLSPTKYPNRIYYLVAGVTVVILHIRHTSRDSPSARDIGS